jgi:anion-transporting  ArsA/GET3 family ATPase
MHDLLVLGQIENFESEPLPTDPRYDLLVLDAPATGHGLTLLQAARTMTEITRAGPFYELSRRIDDFLADPVQTATVLATLPEELPVQEALELAAALIDEGFGPAAVIANQVEGLAIPDPPGHDAVLEALDGVEDAEVLQTLVRAEAARGRRHAGALDQLAAGLRALGVERIYEAPRADVDTVRRVGMALAEGLA